MKLLRKWQTAYKMLFSRKRQTSIKDAIHELKSFITVNEYDRLSRETIMPGTTKEKYFKNNVIVSLTTYGKRIHDVYLAIETLMQQTIKPNQIILWLAENEFTAKTVPERLKKLVKRGLTIDFCEDIRSYKKLIPSLRKFPDDIIITVDDDLLYHADMIENLLSSYSKFPDLIHFCRGHRIKMDKKKKLLAYNGWDLCISDLEPDILNFPTGAGGVLYFPHSLHEEVFNKEAFMALSPTADDVWFKAMALLQNTISKKVFTRQEGFMYMTGDIQKETALFNVNKNGGNDRQIRAVFDKYNLYKLIGAKNAWGL